MAETLAPDIKTETMVLNMGPQHPSTHGVLRLVLDLDGETVLRCVPHLGYLHTGFEKTYEDKTYHQCIPITDRMDYLAPLSNNLAFCLAVEKLLDESERMISPFEHTEVLVEFVQMIKENLP